VEEIDDPVIDVLASQLEAAMAKRPPKPAAEDEGPRELVLADNRKARFNYAIDRKLEAIDKRQSEIVECRFFGGMSIEDTAVALDVSPATVKRHWALARAWLYREMKVRVPAPVA